MSSVEIEETTANETAEQANRRVIEEICQPLVLNDTVLQKIKDLFLNEIKLGLCKTTNSKAMVKCWLTYVQELPSGCETGKFLALDLGGTNFRVLVIHLSGEKDFHMDSQIFEIPAKILVGPGQDLFDHIAECLATFIKTYNLNDGEDLPLGFTFSFPVRQDGLVKGELVAWTKGFNCPGVVGHNVVQLLREAINRRGDINISIFALLNDTTGTLMSCAWRVRNCKIGLIVGTGCNACYLEKLTNMTTYQNPAGITIPTMVINTEWGAFGDDGKLEFVRSKYDKEIDETTHNKSRQLFEKMVAGMYLGEVVRKMLLDCINAGALLQGHVSEGLNTNNAFKTKYISLIESQSSGTHDLAREILDGLGYKTPSDFDCENVRYICEVVSRRSAHLVGSAIACLIDRVGDPYTVVAIDGSVYRHHPHYHCLLTEKIAQLVRPEHKFKLMLSEDGSGRGAALIAAVAATKYRAELEKQKSLASSPQRKSSVSAKRRSGLN